MCARDEGRNGLRDKRKYESDSNHNKKKRRIQSKTRRNKEEEKYERAKEEHEKQKKSWPSIKARTASPAQMLEPHIDLFTTYSLSILRQIVTKVKLDPFRSAVSSAQFRGNFYLEFERSVPQTGLHTLP